MRPNSSIISSDQFFTGRGEKKASFVGRTHTIVSLQTRIGRKDGTENSEGFVYVLDGFLQRDFVLWVFMCSVNRLRPIMSFFPSNYALFFYKSICF